ncbi:DUF1501 domain-containing protein [Rhodopirellula sp. JC740]|uniref:DUF1501 domain-containing protein n=1 Tax=Rhodopirellula halodulae TaxID=2894198 RepID=A0ABS8NF84_9BACT|nr:MULTISPECIES: DUF1501 domain-containing protein [unclassified Rhodopirellula]MCC9642210.1 DUF1501 domain-containing protein [Rhodopirellula sp. JC740]MCC9655814.1 DUF1501 domain-containing protein [Rhodopirellula sp. JC737]
MDLSTPNGMTRRHFMSHLAGSSAAAAAAWTLGGNIAAQADEMRRNRKSAILLWMGGGPPTIDIWDLKPGAPTGGPFRPISTTGNAQICEHMPMMAQQMKHMSVVRSMSTREADHSRGSYYMHTGYVPNPNIEHPSYGSVVAHELMDQRPELEIPPFVSVGGAGAGPGFLGMAWSPFAVTSNGRIRNLQMKLDDQRLLQRMAALNMIESGFAKRTRDTPASEHAKVLGKTLDLMTSEQMEAFRVEKEPDEVKERYGTDNFGQGCLLARRLVEAGVPFVEVDLGGWDLHNNVHATLKDTKLPNLDRAMSALIEDLAQRELIQDTVVMWMGEFGRTPRINANAGRDHFARAWSCVVGGAGINGGLAVGETNFDGTAVETEPYSSEDLMTTVCKGLGISTETTFTSNNGRPMKIAGGGKLIRELVA